MRIAIYHNLLSGGAKRTLMEAGRRLAARHYLDVYSLTSSEQTFSDLRPWTAGHYEYPFRPRPLLRSPWGRLNQLLRLADLRRVRRLARQIASDIDSRRYDVALIHPCQIEQSPSVLRYLRRTPSVYYCQEPLRLLHESMPPRPYVEPGARRRLLDAIDPLPALYRRRLFETDRTNACSAGRVLVNSRFTADSVKRIYGIHPQVSYHGVDAERFRPIGVMKRDIVLSVGSLTPLKGFDFLIKAMAQYPHRGRPTLVIASNFQNPPEQAFLEQLASELNVPVVLQGNVTDDELIRLYNEARVVAYAPVREPFGLVPLEAMACATPVVGVAEGGISESVVHRHTGVLVDRDPGRFAAALRQLVEDAALAAEYGRNGRVHVLRHWSWDTAVQSLERALIAIN